MAKRGGKKTRFSRIRSFIAKNLNVREVKKLARGVIRDIVGESEAGQMRRVRGIVRRAGGGDGKFFGGTAKSQSWSPLTKNLGAKILRMGPNVDPALRAAAQDAVDGVGDYRNEKQLQDILRNGLGIRKSGATWLNRKVTALKQGIQGFAGAGVLFDQAQRGGLSGGVASAALMDMGLGKASEILKSKFAEKVAVGLANAIGKDPTKFTGMLLEIGRGLRMGGAVGAILKVGASVADEYFQQRRRSASAQLATFSAAKAAGIDVAMARRIRQGVGVVKEEGAVGAIKAAFGFTADADEERARRAAEAFKLTANARATAGRLGVDVAAVLERLARARGVAVEDLSAAEINRELDPLITAAARNRVGESAIKAKLVTDKVLAGNKLDSASQIVTDAVGAAVLSVPTMGLAGPALFEWLRSNRAETEVAAAKQAEIDIANRIVEDIKTQPEKQAAAQEAKQGDVPPKMLRLEYQGQGGEEFWVPNPAYERYVAARRINGQQIRDWNMQREANARRRQVAWMD